MHSAPPIVRAPHGGGRFFIPYCISFLLRLIVHSAPHRMGVRTTDSGFYSQFMLLLPPHRMGVRTTDGDI